MLAEEVDFTVDRVEEYGGLLLFTQGGKLELEMAEISKVNNDFFAPDGQDVQLLERYMTPAEDEHPPLISYYRGA